MSLRPLFLVALVAGALSGYAAPVLAQTTGTVVARVVDAETTESLPNATLALYAAADTAFVTGGAADLDGRVRVPVRPGAYLARLSFVGYQTRSVPVEVGTGPIDLGDLALRADAAVLGEAEVTARRELVEQRVDRTVYNVQEQAVTAGGSALETLQTVPSLFVDNDGNVSLRGNQNVVIQIDGRPVPVSGAFLSALLRQIPADQIESVEVIPNPSARYEPDGMSGIVNIVLAEGTDRGLSGGLVLGGGTELSGQAGANVSYQRGPWDVNAQYGLRYGERLTDLSTTLVGSGLTLDQAGETDQGETSHLLTGSVLREVDDRTTLSAEGTLGLRSSGADGFTAFERSAGGTTTTTGRSSDDDDDGLNADLALVFRRQFGDPGAGDAGAADLGGLLPTARRGPLTSGGGGGGVSSAHELAVEGRYTVTDGGGFGRFTDLDDDDLAEALVLGVREQDDDLTVTEASAQVDYAQPVGRFALEVGARVSDECVTSDTRAAVGSDEGSLVPDPTQTNAFTYDRQIGAAYLQGSTAFGPFQVQAGLRAEAARRSFDLATPVPEPFGDGADAEPDELEYASLFPSAFVSWSPSLGSLVRASYSRRIERPSTEFLNPFPDLSDTLLVRLGTPDIRPQYTDAFELTLQYRYALTVTPFFRRTTDVIARRVEIDPATGVSLFRPGNLDAETSYGVDLSLPVPLPGLRGFLSASVYQAVTTDPDPGEEDTEALAFDLRAMLQGSLGPRTDVQAFALYRAPQETVDGRRDAFVFSVLGVNHRLRDDLRLSARLTDPFGLARFSFETDDGVFARDVEVVPGIRSAALTLTYTFGSGRSEPRPQGPQPDGLDDGLGI